VPRTSTVCTSLTVSIEAAIGGTIRG
jgi:hypothetical protein